MWWLRILILLDKWWYSDKECEAEGCFSNAYPAHLEISLKDTNNKLTEQSMYQFLAVTQKQFSGCQIWLLLTLKIKQMIASLKDTKKID